MKKSLKSKVLDIIAQAKYGTVVIGPKNDPINQWRYFVQFASKIEGKINLSNENVPCIKINNFNKFLEDLEIFIQYAKDFYFSEMEYYDINLNTYEQKLILSLFLNPTFQEMEDFNSYVKKRTNGLKNNVNIGNFKLGLYNDLQINAKITKNISTLEAPYNFQPYFISNETNEEFYLPSIHFFIDNDIVNIQGVQNKYRNQNNGLEKKLDRHFRKVNKGVDLEDDISKVTPNALVSLTLFLSTIKQQSLTKVIAPDYLPIRYNASKTMQQNRNISDEEIEDNLEKLNRDQFNMTNKFMTLFLRYEHHFNESHCEYDDVSQQMKLKLSKEQPEFDNILYDLDKSVKLAKPFLTKENNELTK